jgi:prevent-host-death family protein
MSSSVVRAKAELNRVLDQRYEAGLAEIDSPDLADQRVAGTVASCSALCYTKPVATTIPQRELRNDNARVIEAVAAGETFVVTRNGIPVAELRPIRSQRRQFVPKTEIVDLAAAGPHVDLEQFRADLDHAIDQSL